MQRGGPIGSSLSDITDLCAAIKAIGAKIVYDLDDDLLAQHPSAPVERGLEDMRPKVKFLLREADAVDRFRFRARRSHKAARTTCRNLEERARRGARSAIDGGARKADLGYFGTSSHLQDLMGVINSLATAVVRGREKPRFELCGISDDRRIAGLLAHCFDVRHRPIPEHYSRFHTMLATEARYAVGLAPLLSGVFNNARSDIKVLDHAAAGIPVVVSDACPYQHLDATRSVVRASITEFGSAVFALLRDQDRRREMAAAAHSELMGNRVLAKRAPDLLLILQQVLDRAPLTVWAEPLARNEILLETLESRQT